MSDTAPPAKPRRKISFSTTRRVHKFTLHANERKGTVKGSQTLRQFKHIIEPQIRKHHEKGAYGDKSLANVLKAKKKEFRDSRTRTRRKGRLLTVEKDGTVAHYMAQLVKYINDNNIQITHTTLTEIFDNIEEKYTDPYICTKYKKAVLKYFIGRKKDRSNSLLNTELTTSQLADLIERSKVCPEHHKQEHHKIESPASMSKSNKPSNNKPNTATTTTTTE